MSKRQEHEGDEGDGLAECLNRRPELTVASVVTDLAALRKTLSAVDADIALIDITQAVDFEEIHAFAADLPNLTLVALGLPEQRRDAIRRRGRAAFSGFAERDATTDVLCDALKNAVASPLTKPDDTSPGLLRRCFAWMRHPLSRRRHTL